MTHGWDVLTALRGDITKGYSYIGYYGGLPSRKGEFDSRIPLS